MNIFGINGGCGESCMSTIASMNCIGVNISNPTNPPTDPTNPVETKEVPVKISFVDKNGTPITENLPESVNLSLINVIANKVANSENNYSVTFFNVPTNITYQVQANVDGYETSVNQTTDGVSIIFKSDTTVEPPKPETETYTVKVNTIEGLDSVTVNLMDGDTVKESKTANEENSFEVEFNFEKPTNPYTITVTPVENFKFDITNEGNNYTINVTKEDTTPEPPVEPENETYNVKVEFVDSEGNSDDYSEDVNVYLKDNDAVLQTEVASKSNNYSVSFTFAKEADRTETISADEIEGYTMEITNSENEYTIKYTKEATEP